MVNDEKRIKYPIGIQNFTKLREEGYLYVDKTASIYPLIRDGGYYFLSRPRRFGKSLLLSTLEAYYQGRRDLFKGLALDSLTEEWDSHPILHLDLNNREYKDADSLKAELNANLELWEQEYGDGKKDRAPEERFSYVIRRAYELTGKKVVILVDEYDKPLLNSLDRPELTEAYRSQLKAFYSNLKTMDPYIKIAFLTGVARFSKVSIFSDLNNLRDISFVDEFAGICGVTAAELEEYFGPGIEKLASIEGVSVEEIKKDLQRNFDGYHFSPASPDIYNPFSLINTFANGDISDFWYRTGTPTFLVKIARRLNLPFRDIAPVKIPRADLEDGGVFSPDGIPAFYQTGYLTIKDYDRRRRLFTLDYPNAEVKEGFLKFLMYSYMPVMQTNKTFSIFHFIDDVEKGDAEGFMKRMESMIADAPYSEKGSAESHFQNAVYLLFTLMGFYCRMEERTSNGRIDILLDTDRYIFIIEFKVDSSSRAAMDQIEEKKYWLPYEASGKEIVLIGANFDTKTRCLSDDPAICRILPTTL